METEDFSFPRISDTCPHNIDSPPLWNLSPASSPNPYNKGENKNCFGEKLVAQAQRKSFSCVENGKKRIGLDDDDAEEGDRMDLLWEDLNLNEELSSSTTGSATSSSREGAEFKCAPMLTVAKNNKGALLPTKNKPGMVVIVNVMKRLFFTKNSQRKSRNRVR